MVASYLLQPSPGVNICKGRFPQLDNAMTAMKFFSLGKRIKVKQLNVQLWCTTDAGITLEVQLGSCEGEELGGDSWLKWEHFFVFNMKLGVTQHLISKSYQQPENKCINYYLAEARFFYWCIRTWISTRAAQRKQRGQGHLQGLPCI